MNKIRLIFFGLMAFLMTTSISLAQEQKLSANEITQFKNGVITQAKAIKSLKTDFVQYKHMSFLFNEIETSGNMVFQAPNLLNWRYTKPYQYSIVFKQGKIHINDQGNNSRFDASVNK